MTSVMKQLPIQNNTINSIKQCLKYVHIVTKHLLDYNDIYNRTKDAIAQHKEASNRYYST